jgi:hypothetical protein
LIHEERWELISKLLAESIPVKYVRRESGPGNCFFADISQSLVFSSQLSQLRECMSIHADILKARHASERVLGQIIPFDAFIDADYFLFLRGELAPETAPAASFAWRPWSTPFLTEVPRFIRDAESLTVARRIAAALGLPDVPTFRQRLAERASKLQRMWTRGWWDEPLHAADIDRIGTRGT